MRDEYNAYREDVEQADELIKRAIVLIATAQVVPDRLEEYLKWMDDVNKHLGGKE